MRTFAMLPPKKWVGLLLICWTGACTASGSLRAGIYTNPKENLSFRVGSLPADWLCNTDRKEETDNNILCKSQKHDGVFIMVDASCPTTGQGEDATLRLNKGLKDFRDREEQIPPSFFDLDGRKAVRLQERGTINGYLFDFDVVGLVKNGCFYQMRLFVNRDPKEFPRNQDPKNLADLHSQFETLFQGFGTL